MLRKLRPRSAYDVMAAIALFIALAGGTAYAANTIGSADVIDGSLTGAGVKGDNGNSTTAATNGSSGTADIAGQPSNSALGQPNINGSLTTYDIQDRTLRGGDHALNSLTASELGPNSASTSEIKDGSVTPAKLAVPQAWQNVNAPDDTHCNGPASGGYFSCFNNFGSVSSYWGNDSDTSNNAAAYYKDASGVVHFKGIVCRAVSGCGDFGYSGNETMLYLPTAY